MKMTTQNDSMLISQQLREAIPEMCQFGIRRLLIISGEETWCQQQAWLCCQVLENDLLWVGADVPTEAITSRSFQQAKRGLGQQLNHVICNVFSEFHPEAIAVLAGAIQAGHWLILLTPSWQQWASYPDRDSLRWHQQSEPVATPNFITHMQQVSQAMSEVSIWRQHEACTSVPSLSSGLLLPVWQPPNGAATVEQQVILQQLLAAPAAVNVIVGERGRGKSTLAGMLAQQLNEECWVTAPNKSAAQVMCHMGEKIPFYAPDVLLEKCRQHHYRPDWLLVDEAAAIPAPVLKRLLSYFSHVLLTTTVQGYEGTGRGFLLKFCAQLPHYRLFTLSTPMRWAPYDPLERWLNKVLLLSECEAISVTERPGSLNLIRLEKVLWRENPQWMREFYLLLTSAHYRTTPLDLRRLMDGVGNYLLAAEANQQIIAALWGVDEGGLSSQLAQAVWAGERRPKGNLVAQSLAAHGGQPIAAQLYSRRLSRIAVTPNLRCQGIGKALVQHAVEQGEKDNIDYLSVSFGYTPDLYRFWRQAGFHLVRFSTQQEASSGCYSAMMIYPLTEPAQQLQSVLTYRLQRDSYWLQQCITIAFPLDNIIDQRVNEDDLRELAGFAYGFRALDSACYALHRYIIAYQITDPLLQNVCQPKVCLADVAKQNGFTGKKALIQALRQRVSLALNQHVE